LSQAADRRTVANDVHSPDFVEHRAHVGVHEDYDLGSAIQFNLLTTLGLRDYHYLLDIGCGSLRAGRLFIPYLLPGRYFGIEPLDWLLKAGIEKELGQSVIELKKPVFSNDDNFTLSTFDRQFDFIIAQSIFSHASQAQISRCLAEAKRVMKPTSIFAATFVEGEKNYEGNRWVVCAEYTLQRMRKLIETEGLVCQPIDWPHHDVQRWILILPPGNEVRIAPCHDLNRMVHLENQLARANRQLVSLRNRFVVRAGRRMKFFLTWLRFKWREGRRRVRQLRQR
jgi:SAM-dependent methyltransferase